MILKPEDLSIKDNYKLIVQNRIKKNCFVVYIVIQLYTI